MREDHEPVELPFKSLRVGFYPYEDRSELNEFGLANYGSGEATDSDTSPETSPTTENFPQNEEQTNDIEKTTALEIDTVRQDIIKVDQAEGCPAMAEAITGAEVDDSASMEGETSFTETDTTVNDDETPLTGAEQDLMDTDDESDLAKDVDQTQDDGLETVLFEKASREDSASAASGADQGCMKKAKTAATDDASQTQLYGEEALLADDVEGEEARTAKAHERSPPTTDVTLSQWTLHFG